MSAKTADCLVIAPVVEQELLRRTAFGLGRGTAFGQGLGFGWVTARLWLDGPRYGVLPGSDYGTIGKSFASGERAGRAARGAGVRAAAWWSLP